MAVMSILALNQSDSPFDTIRRVDGQGNEFWSARELMPILNYKMWQKFKFVIENAKENIETVTQSSFEHFLPVEVKSHGRNGLDYKLSRLACYHVALCCDSRGNDSVKMAKHYFAIKTREAETVIPAQNERLRELELVNENLKLQLAMANRVDSMAIMHGVPVTLTLLGRGDCVAERETTVTEVVEPATGKSAKILSAEQLKRAIKQRTGQNIPSLKSFADSLRKAGRDDLLIPVTRSQTSEYVIPEKLDEAIDIVFGKQRQRLLGE